MSNGTVKGLLFHHLQEFARSKGGTDAYERVIAQLGPVDQEVLRGIVLAGGMYPIGTWNRSLDAFLRTAFADPKRGMDEFSTFLGDKELRGLVKFVLKLGSPEFMLNRANFLWGRYFSGGTFTVEQAGPRHFRLFLESPTGEDAGPSRWNCAHGPGPWLTQGLHLGGNPGGLVEHLKCRFDGAPRCEFRATW